jgi:hypothetical protein
MNPMMAAHMNGHDPYAYLKDVPMRLPTQRASEIEELLPHKWSESQSDWIGERYISNRAIPSDG